MHLYFLKYIMKKFFFATSLLISGFTFSSLIPLHIDWGFGDLSAAMEKVIPAGTKKMEPEKPSGTKYNQIVKVLIKKDTECRKVIKDEQLYAEGWDTLAQPRFWSEIISLDPSYSLINTAEKREILGVISSKYYERLSGTQQKNFKDSIKYANGLSSNTSIMVTSGKNHYYLIRETIPNISRAIDIFTQEGTDPWFAQVILMIESPGANRTSEVGASGAFQIMPDVAREYGMVVNGQVDERSNFRKSAQVAARLLKSIYIPKVKGILNSRGIAYNENDMWFRMLVLHAYHAGPGNVNAVINAIHPRYGGVELMKKVWTTEAGGFGNASQNYSQIALAALVELDHILAKYATDVCDVSNQSY